MKRKQLKTAKKNWPVKRARLASNVILPPLSGKAWDKERIFRFKRRQNDAFALVMSGSVGNTYKGIDFQLDKTEQYTELVNLFDQYRITGIKVQGFPRFNMFDIQGATSTFTHVPPLLAVIDTDDATTPTDYKDLISDEHCLTLDPYKPFKFTFRPKCAQSQFGSTAFGQYGVTESTQWMNCASDDIEYYGVKMGTLPYSLSNNDVNPPAWDLLYTYMIECRYAK